VTIVTIVTQQFHNTRRRRTIRRYAGRTQYATSSTSPLSTSQMTAIISAKRGWLRREQGDVLTEGGCMIIDREESQIGAGELSQLLARYSGKATLGVLHYHDGVDPEYLAGQGQAAQDIVCHPATGIANDVCFTEM
jgi:hypothetical protein